MASVAQQWAIQEPSRSKARGQHKPEQLLRRRQRAVAAVAGVRMTVYAVGSMVRGDGRREAEAAFQFSRWITARSAEEALDLARKRGYYAPVVDRERLTEEERKQAHWSN